MFHPIVNVAIDAARKAGDIAVRALDRPGEIKIVAKSGKSMSTNVDLRAEEAIIYVLQKSYPDYGFICEESGEIEGNGEFTWIIDPLDGTTNFIHGYPHFCVSIALMQGDQIEHGVIYDPIRQELFTATRGRGAQLNQRRIRVTPSRKLEGTLINTSARHYVRQDELAKITAGIRRSGSAALDLAYVAAGRLDALIDFNLKIWDIAAGALLVQEAGGIVTDEEGNDNYLESGNVIAANPTLIAPLINTLV